VLLIRVEIETYTYRTQIGKKIVTTEIGERESKAIERKAIERKEKKRKDQRRNRKDAIGKREGKPIRFIP